MYSGRSMLPSVFAQFALAVVFLLMPIADILAETDPDDIYADQSEENQRAIGGVGIEEYSEHSKAKMAQGYEYRIGPGDLLAVDVFMVDELSHETRVNSKGQISLPLVGVVDAKGKTVEEVEKVIEQRLAKDYLKDPHVSVFVKEYESQKVTVNGWVRSPGIFPLKGKTTLLQVVSMAKGLDKLSDPAEVVIFREIPDKGTVGYKINLEQVQAGEVTNPVLQANDIVVVPKSGSKAMIHETRENLRVFLGFLPFL